jgi:hypothetical protein
MPVRSLSKLKRCWIRGSVARPMEPQPIMTISLRISYYQSMIVFALSLFHDLSPERAVPRQVPTNNSQRTSKVLTGNFLISHHPSAPSLIINSSDQTLFARRASCASDLPGCTFELTDAWLLSPLLSPPRLHHIPLAFKAPEATLHLSLLYPSWSRARLTCTLLSFVKLIHRDSQIHRRRRCTCGSCSCSPVDAPSSATFTGVFASPRAGIGTLRPLRSRAG